MHSDLSRLIARFPRIVLTDLPSPVFAARAEHGLQPELDNIYIKHDGVCATSYAGNKVRKLEFLLAEAQQRGARHIVTLGAAGSNHAVATSTYAHQLGMRCTVCMTHQPPSPVATRNLRRHLALGTDLHVYPRYWQALEHAESLARRKDTHLIPLGGSAPLASLGYIVAAAELSAQIDQGLLPEPERVYVACGTMGTAVGLTLGLALLRRPITTVAVRVTDPAVASPARFADLYAASAALVNAHSDYAVNPQLEPGQLLFTEEFYGRAYAEPTPEALQAMDMASTIDLTLDGTYTGKAFAALLAHRASGDFDGPALFWCTLNAVETPLADASALADLGEAFDRYR